MNTYIYQADLYCEDCACAIKMKLTIPERPDDDTTFDSDDFPKGPFSKGGGEADSPNHCGRCGCFLENPLTTDGYNYVVEQIKSHLSETEALWVDYYNITIDHN